MQFQSLRNNYQHCNTQANDRTIGSTNNLLCSNKRT